MYRFAVFDNNGVPSDWPLKHACLLGPEDAVVKGKVAFRDGHIVFRRPGNQACALSLLHETGPMGRLVLQTCLLPERERPYILSVELARHRIKTFIAKSEEWQMFDLSAEHPATRHWEEARQLLTRALTEPDPVAADRLATQSLNQAIEATERLAMAHAEILLHRRFAQRAASSATLGVRVWPGRDGKQLRELIASSFDLLVLPIRWRELEVEEGSYNWGPIDRWMEWASAQGKPIVAGPLVDFSKAALPDWMYVWQHDYDTCRDLVYEYMERIVARYTSVVNMWNIASGLNVNDNFQFTPEQMLDLARMSSLLVRQSRKGARTLIELRQPFGEHCAQENKSMSPLAFVDRLLQEGIKFDALGVQLLFGSDGAGRVTRDLMQVSSLLDRFLLFETPLLVSAMGVPSAPCPAEGGSWHGAWDADLQSRWVGRMFAIAMSKPFVESVFWTDLYDHPQADLENAGLIGDDGKPKTALGRLVGMRRRLRRPLGPLKLPTRADA